MRLNGIARAGIYNFLFTSRGIRKTYLMERFRYDAKQ